MEQNDVFFFKSTVNLKQCETVQIDYKFFQDEQKEKCLKTMDTVVEMKPPRGHQHPVSEWQFKPFYCTLSPALGRRRDDKPSTWPSATHTRDPGTAVTLSWA